MRLLQLMRLQISKYIMVDGGLQVQDGIVPEDNISDSASQAWNDAITISNSFDNTNISAGSLPLIVMHSQTTQQQHSKGLLRISLEVDNEGIRFGLFEHGESVLSLLLTDPAPRQQLNDFIFRAIKPLLASRRPWNNGYGFKHECMNVEFVVALGEEGLILSNTYSALSLTSSAPAVVIEALSPEQSMPPSLNHHVTLADTTLNMVQSMDICQQVSREIVAETFPVFGGALQSSLIPSTGPRGDRIP
ncbi:hypothetical protein D1007_39513 [Hordeum vulgare]|nr:hypothetical protein D1007_39513 [Hordeum vulgare]